MRKLRLRPFGFFGGLIIAAAVGGQVKYLPEFVGKVGIELDTANSATALYGLSTAEANQFHQNLRPLRDWILAQPAVSPPRGFKISGRMRAVQSSLCQAEPCLRVPVAGLIHLPFYEYIEFEGKRMTAPEYGNSVEFIVNEPGPSALFTYYAPDRLFTVSGTRICFQLPRLGDIQGFPAYGNGGRFVYLILTKNKKPPFLPLTQEAYLQTLIRFWEGEEAKLTQVSLDPSGDAYRQWIARKEERQKQFQQIYEKLKKYDSHNAEAFRRKSEELEKKMEEGYKKDMAKNPPKNSPPSDIRDLLSRLKGQLASMTPAQRNAQARWESGLRSADSPNGKPLVIVNPEIINPALPPTAIQLIHVFFDYDDDYYHPGMPKPDQAAARGVYALLKTSDWKALWSLLAE